MTRSIFAVLLAIAFLGTVTTVADELATVRTHTLTVEEKLELLETIEITSEKELKETDEPADPEVEAILEELAQLESESVSNE